MKEGDLFYIHELDEILTYKVDRISVVLPDETDALQIEEGKDYVTLLDVYPLWRKQSQASGQGRTYRESGDCGFTGEGRQTCKYSRLCSFCGNHSDRVLYMVQT